METFMLAVHIIIGFSFVIASLGKLFANRLLQRLFIPMGLATAISGLTLVLFGGSFTQVCLRFAVVASAASLVYLLSAKYSA